MWVGELPESKAKALDQEEKPVQISLDAAGVIHVDDLPIVAADLPARLAAVAAGAKAPGGPRIFLRADRTLDYGRVMAVMGEINAAGLRKVALVSTQSEARR